MIKTAKLNFCLKLTSICQTARNNVDNKFNNCILVQHQISIDN